MTNGINALPVRLKDFGIEMIGYLALVGRTYSDEEIEVAITELQATFHQIADSLHNETNSTETTPWR